MLRVLLILLLATACVVGAPPGFSDGDLWSVPMVAPLENDHLLVPVSINGEGPFLFMIDPDSEVSSIESSLQASLNLYAGRASGQKQTEEDHLVRVIVAQVKKLTIGTLSVRTLQVFVHDDGTFWSGGRRVRGVIGRDIISDSLIYSFDRDRGMMYIGTQGHLKAPDGAAPIKFTQSYSRHRRYLAKIKLNNEHKVTMHMDLGARTSLLWPELIRKFKLPSIPVEAELVDEFGTVRRINSGTIAGIVEAGETTTNAMLMLPYADKRLEPEDLDGVIGMNFWSKFNVTVNWHRKKFWLQPRATDVAAGAETRMARWGDSLDACKQPACVAVSLQGLPAAAPAPAPAPAEVPAEEAAAGEYGEAAPAPAPVSPAPATAPATAPVSEAPGAALRLLIEREAPGTNFAYDVVIGAVDANGAALLNMPLFLASFRSGVSSLLVEGLDPDFAKAAKFVVLDMNPVGTRGCEGQQCVYQLRP